MAGFEGPADPGSGRDGTTKLPSWAVTRSSPEPDLSDPTPLTAPADSLGPTSFADVGAAGPNRDAPKPERPVVRVPEHPFDLDDPFGDNQPGGVGSPWNRPPADDSEVRVVDLADEFELTTAQALEVCAASGTPASSGAAWLTVEQAEAFRRAVATYDRTEPSDSPYPAWAVPPGGRRPPLHRADAQAVVPGAALLARTPPPDDDPEPSDGGRMRVVLLVVSLLVIAVLVAMMLLG